MIYAMNDMSNQPAAVVQSGAAVVQPGAAVVQPGATVVQPGAAVVQPGAPPAYSPEASLPPEVVATRTPDISPGCEFYLKLTSAKS